MPKKVMAFLFCVLLPLSTAGSGETLRLAVFQLEPFMMASADGGVTGVTVEYWRTWLAPRMGYELEVLGPFPIKRAEKMLENGEVDAVCQLTRIPDREVRFRYPKTPLTQIVSCIAVTRESPLVSVDSTKNFYDLKLGFIEAAYIPPMLKHPRIRFELVSNEDYRMINLNKLFAGRLDALLDINWVSFLYYIAEHDMTQRLRIMLLPVEPVPVFTIFRKDARGAVLAAQYDNANAEGIRLGVFDRMTEDFLKGPVITE